MTFLQRNSLQRCIITLYADNSIITGNEDLVQEAIRDLKKFFNMTVQVTLKITWDVRSLRPKMDFR